MIFKNKNKLFSISRNNKLINKNKMLDNSSKSIYNLLNKMINTLISSIKIRYKR